MITDVLQFRCQSFCEISFKTLWDIMNIYIVRLKNMSLIPYYFAISLLTKLDNIWRNAFKRNVITAHDQNQIPYDNTMIKVVYLFC